MCRRKNDSRTGRIQGKARGPKNISVCSGGLFRAPAAISQRPPRFRTLLSLKFIQILKRRPLRRAAERAEIAIAREKRDERPTPFGTLRSSAQGECFPSRESTSSPDHDHAFLHFRSSATKDANEREGRRSRNYHWTLSPQLANVIGEPLGLNSHVANPTHQVIACVFVCFDGHDLDRIRLVMWTQDQVVPR